MACWQRGLGWLVVLSLAAAPAAAAERVFTDPAKAGPDFAFQGEYAGTLKTDQGEVKGGVQVIAQGDGKFAVVGFAGGLPGDGWDGGKRHERADYIGQLKDGVVTFTPTEGDMVTTIKDGVLSFQRAGAKIGEFKKVVRKSPTLGAKPPAGATVLFDGATADTFLNGRMTQDGLLMEGPTSKAKLADSTMHIEFLLPFQPYDRGQGRANSGCYVQGRYEIQVLDSFGLTGEDNECGGVYHAAKPLLNMCYPPLSWQTYDIDFTAPKFDNGKKVKNARITLRHNGVVIHDNLQLQALSPGGVSGSETSEPGPLFLQNHGNPVRFRNIWAVEKK
jgi:hypothetical protein